jgi:hypothetical protein
MSRYLLIVLLLTTDVALAANKPGAKHETAVAQQKTAVVSAQTHEAQTKTKGAEVQTEVVQPEIQESQGHSATAETQASEAAAQSQADKQGTLTSVPGGKALGMSVLGNQEAPTSLVIVPWKTSEVGRSLSISPMLDDSRQPVDKEVFMRALRYYEIRSETKQ